MSTRIKTKNGFTLLELLVVVVIIGILATLSTVALNSIRAKARNARRISDIKQLQTALELYFTDENGYPATSAVTPNSPLVGLDTFRTYMDKVPSNPMPRVEGACAANEDYSYRQINGGTSYEIDYCLSGSVNELAAGLAVAKPGNIYTSRGPAVCSPNCTGKCGGDDGCGASCANTCSGGTPYCSNDDVSCLAYPSCPTSVCGDCSTVTCGQTCTTNVTKDGANYSETYGTLQVGGQCWLDKNINNVGTNVSAGTYSNNSLIERWCYGNNCDGSNALYAWNEAMYLPAIYNSTQFTGYIGTGASAKRQGICPKGWHIPSDAEWLVLEKALDVGVTDTVSYYADQMLTGGIIGFRGTASNWTSGVGAKLYCRTVTGNCTAAAVAAVAPKFGLIGDWNGSSFGNGGNGDYILTSSQYSATSIWNRTTHTTLSQSNRINYEKNTGRVLRCLKD